MRAESKNGLRPKAALPSIGRQAVAHRAPGTSPSDPAVSEVLRLQRTAGNRATRQLLAGVASQGAAVTVQRVHLRAVEKDLDKQGRTDVRAWLEARLGKAVDWAAYEQANGVQVIEDEMMGRMEMTHWDADHPVNQFLDLFQNAEEVMERVTRWKENRGKEEAAVVGRLLDSDPPETTEAAVIRAQGLIAKSPFGHLIKSKIDFDPADVFVLGDADFAQAHAADVKKKNSHKGWNQEDMEIAIRLGMTKIDLVAGFTTVDNRIVLRQGNVTDHVLIHEAMHKLTGDNFLKSFGNPLNEGVTELAARVVCANSKPPVEFDRGAYPRETLLTVLVFEEKLGLGKGDYIAAYISGETSELRSRFERWLWGKSFGGFLGSISHKVFGGASPVEGFINEKDAKTAFGVAKRLPKLQ